MAEIDATGRSTREVNAAIRKSIAEGCTAITVLNPEARHNLAVAILNGVHVRIAGSAGYYCGGLGDGASIEVDGSAGWGLAESMLSGTVVVRGNAGSGAAARVKAPLVKAAPWALHINQGSVLVNQTCCLCRDDALGQHRFDAAQGLARSFFVLDEGEADVVVAVFAEAYAGTDGGFGFGQKQLRKLERLEVAVRLGNLGPDEHRRSGFGDGPAGLVEAFDEDIAAAAVVIANLRDTFLRAFECRNRLVQPFTLRYQERDDVISWHMTRIVSQRKNK